MSQRKRRLEPEECTTRRAQPWEVTRPLVWRQSSPNSSFLTAFLLSERVLMLSLYLPKKNGCCSVLACFTCRFEVLLAQVRKVRPRLERFGGCFGAPFDEPRKIRIQLKEERAFCCTNANIVGASIERMQNPTYAREESWCSTWSLNLCFSFLELEKSFRCALLAPNRHGTKGFS